MKKQTNPIYRRLTHPYRLILRNAHTFEERLHIKINYAIVCLFAAFIIFSSVFLGIWGYSRWVSSQSQSGNQEFKNRRRLLILAQKIDSLALMIEERDLAIKNLQLVINEGKELFAKPAAAIEDQKSAVFNDTHTAAEMVIRNEFEHWDHINLKNKSSQVSDLGPDFPVLRLPVVGLISARFSDSKNHFGVDLVAAPDAPVLAVAAGKIILAQWNPETGHLVCIQHPNGLVSIYKHNSSVICKPGQEVVAGQPIAIIGGSGRLSNGPHLHFEMWLHAQPLDPNKYLKLGVGSFE